MSRKKQKSIYQYKCTITEEVFTTTREAPNEDELITVKAYYQLHPEKDDRPESIKKMLESKEG